MFAQGGTESNAIARPIGPAQVMRNSREHREALASATLRLEPPARHPVADEIVHAEAALGVLLNDLVSSDFDCASHALRVPDVAINTDDLLACINEQARYVKILDVREERPASSARDLFFSLRSGKTLFLEDAEQRCREVAELTTFVRRRLDHIGVRANVYVSPPGGPPARPVHDDASPALVLQLHGSKRWCVWNRRELPNMAPQADWLMTTPEHIVEVPETAQPALDLDLQSGQAIYIRRGDPHIAHTEGDSVSIHLTLMLFVPTARDIAIAVLERILQAPQYRSLMPLDGEFAYTDDSVMRSTRAVRALVKRIGRDVGRIDADEEVRAVRHARVANDVVALTQKVLDVSDRRERGWRANVGLGSVCFEFVSPIAVVGAGARIELSSAPAALLRELLAAHYRGASRGVKSDQAVSGAFDSVELAQIDELVAMGILAYTTGRTDAESRPAGE
jgi:hypothetical protein